MLMLRLLSPKLLMKHSINNSFQTNVFSFILYIKIGQYSYYEYWPICFCVKQIELYLVNN